MLAQPLLAGDRAAFLGGHDLLARPRRAWPRASRAAGDRVALGESLGARRGSALRRARSGRRARSSRRRARARASPRRTAPCDRPRCTARAGRGPSRASSRGPRCPWSGAPCSVPGSTRGPCVALKASCAARGTRGGFTRIDQDTRLMPRRLLAGIVSTSLPAASRISSLIGPKRWRAALVVGDHGAARRIRARRRSRRPRPSRPARASAAGRAGRAGTPPASRAASALSARSGVMSSTIQMPRPCVAITRSWSRGWTCEVAHRDAREVAALELRPGARRRRSRSTARTRCRRRAASGSTTSSLMTWA